VHSEAEAKAIAQRALARIGTVGGPLVVTPDKSGWTVATPPPPPDRGSISYPVHVDRTTGSADVSSYQVVHIDETF